MLLLCAITSCDRQHELMHQQTREVKNVYIVYLLLLIFAVWELVAIERHLKKVEHLLTERGRSCERTADEHKLD